MSGVALVRAILLANAGFVALLAPDPTLRTTAGEVPSDSSLPAVGITEVSRAEPARLAILPGEKVTVRARIQVTVCAATYPAKDAIVLAVRKALRMYIGDVTLSSGTIHVEAHLAGLGPDFRADGADFLVQTQDVMVSYEENAF